MKIPKKVLSLGLSLMLVIGFAPNAEAISSVDKIQGKDRYETAAKIAEKQNYTTAILVNSDKSLADGLSASGLSGTVDAPILLTKKDSIPNVTLDKLKGVTKVYIIGGIGSIDESLEAQLKEKGIEVVRIGGNNRIETSYNVAKEINNIQPVKKVVFTNAYKGEPDAMSVASVAARDNSPIVLTDGTSVDESSITFDIKAVESYAIGGVIAISDKLVRDTNSTRLGGIDRFDTNKKIINKFYPGAKNFYIAKSHNLVDALTGSAIAKDMPIVLVNNGSDKTILKNAEKVTLLGGISESVLQECLNIINNIGNPNTGAYTVENAADVVKKITGVNIVFYGDEYLENEDFIFLVDKNFTYGGKKYFVFGRISNGHEYDFRYCVDKNNISKISTYHASGVMNLYNRNDYEKKNITEDQARQIALKECAKKSGSNINNLVVDMSEFREDENLYAVRIDSNNSNATFGWFFVSIDGEILD